MKCIRRASSEDGIIPNFKEHECDIPKDVNQNEIVVQVKACGLSLIDHKILCELFKKQIKEDYPVGQDVSGIVTQVGKKVTHVKTGDHVVGIIPIDSCYSGCGQYCVFQEYNVVKKPHHVSFEEAASGIGDCVRAYTALCYHGKVGMGDTVLVIDGASHSGTIAIQLAQHWGAKVLTTYSTLAEKQYLDTLQPPVAQITELSKKNNMFVSSIMEETGGIGVDCLIDNGVRMFNNEDDIKLLNEKYTFPVPHKHDLISCLGFSGKWITSQPNLQLDPPDCQQLFLRGGSVSFLFHQAWILTNSQQGRYQHILKDSIKKIADGVLKCKISKIVNYETCIETLKNLPDERVGKVVLLF